MKRSTPFLCLLLLAIPVMAAKYSEYGKTNTILPTDTILTAHGVATNLGVKFADFPQPTWKTNGVADITIIDVSKNYAATNISTDITITSLSGVTGTNVDWAVRVFTNTSGSTKSITFPSDWTVVGGPVQYITNQAAFSVVAYPGFSTNVIFNDVGRANTLPTDAYTWYSVDTNYYSASGAAVLTNMGSAGTLLNLTNRQSGTANQPLFVTNALNGMAALRFGNAMNLQNFAYYSPQPHEIWAVVKYPYFGGSVKPISDSTTVGSRQIFRIAGDSSITLNAGTSFFGVPYTTYSNWCIITAVFDGATSKIYTNNVFYDTGNANTASCQGFTMGNTYLGDGNNDIQIAELITFAGKPLDRARGGFADDVYRYLTNKYALLNYTNVTLNLSNWWKMDENTSTTVGDSGPLTNGATMSSSAGWIYGKYVTGVRAEWMPQLGTNTTVGADGLTLAAWVYPTNLYINGGGPIIYDSDNNGSLGFFASMWGSTNISFDSPTPTTNLRRHSTVVIPTNAWTHIAITWTGSKTDATTVKIYTNGVEATNYRNESTGSGTYSPNTTTSRWIGGGGSGSTGNAAWGYIDDVKLYGRVLNAAEITHVYKWNP